MNESSKKEIALTEQTEEQLSDIEQIRRLTNPRQRKFLRCLMQNPSIRAAAKMADMPFQNHYAWYKKDPAYSEVFQLARTIGFEAFEDAVIEQSGRDKKQYLGKIFILKGAFPMKYRDNIPLAITSTGPTQININLGSTEPTAANEPVDITNQDPRYDALAGPRRPDK